MSQIALPLAWPSDGAGEDFIVSDANAAVARHLDHWTLWPVAATLLTGPRKSGRSLLGRLFVRRHAGAVLIDNAEAQPQEALFHAWNTAQAERHPLLLIADRLPAEWVTLPDLASRLTATPVVTIDDPDDALIAALVEKLLGARGLAAPREVTAWLVPRIERSYVAIHRAVDALDEAAFSRRARITVPMAKQALAGHLARQGVIDD